MNNFFCLLKRKCWGVDNDSSQVNRTTVRYYHENSRMSSSGVFEKGLRRVIGFEARMTLLK
jgi:hypothetical protein